MGLKIYHFAALLASLGSLTYGNIDITDPCRYPLAVGLEKEYIPNENMWSTSQTNIARGPQFARLRGWKGGGAWTAGVPNNEQHLGIDMGYRHVVSGVATQGRRGSNEFVTEYYIEYSSDNQTWNSYTNRYNTPLMFLGNDDDDTVKHNNMIYPIVARYIRFNPQRWNKFISMRVEVYGCRFDGESATYDSHSRITYDVSGQDQYVQTRQDHLKLRFRTNHADGLMFFADGNQGDYVVLEMVRGRLYFHIDLGSTPRASGDSTFRAGSLLDDNQWHDVEITRTGREVHFNVDRLTIINMTNGEFLQLDLDRKIQLGGIDTFLQPGKRILARHNFMGCMENVWWNQMNIIKDARLGRPRFNMHGGVMLGMCQTEPVVPITFPNAEAHLNVKSETGQRVRVAFHFRTFSNDGLLVVHNLQPSGRVMMKINDEGHLMYTVKAGEQPEIQSVIKNVDLLSESDTFTDGLWHSVSIDIESGGGDRIGKINITVDGRPDASNRQLAFTSTDTYLIGGGDDEGGEMGFIGCMRFLFVGNEGLDKIPPEFNRGIINGTCTIQDRCDPNPCEHGGICSQDYNSFSCNCDNTGYEGAVCHRSKYLVSCEEARQLNPTLTNKEIFIDVDGSGPLKPIHVNCVFQQDRMEAITEVRHDTMEPTVVNGYDGPGSYVKPIFYNAEREQFDELIERSSRCEQYIKYRCLQSRLLSDPGSSDPNIPSYGWWVGRTNLNMRYWGGSSPGSQKCQCALRNECIMNNQYCNCDAGRNSWEIDDGMLEHKEHLPVMELRFGDTGTIQDLTKQAEHTLGPLRCYNDNLFDNIVTFVKRDATIEFPTFDAATSGDIRFQFKTTAPNGIFIQNTGPQNFIEVKLVFGNIIQFRFDVGNGVQTLEKQTAYPMNDNEWHTVHVERNRKQATLKVDSEAEIVQDEPSDQGYRTLDLTSSFVVGAGVDYKDGYVGCMRALMANGRILDLRGKVETGETTYGVRAGCHPKCDSNPCMNEGICLEYYSHYMCDCAYTPYRGWICGREVGVNLQAGWMVRYSFDLSSGSISTDEETITIGFSSQFKQGILMQITNNDTVRPEYISIEMNNNGGVKVALDVGFDRDEVNTNIQNVDLANGQQHVVLVRRYDKGRTLELKVDDYPPAYGRWANLPDSADTKLDNPRYIYFGKNGTTATGEGFKGCLFRAMFDNVYPFKRVFQDPRPSIIKLEPRERIREDMCGFEEVTYSPEPPEFRPTPTIPANVTVESGGSLDQMAAGEKALLGAILAVVCLVLIGLAFLLGRYFTQRRHKGDYLTHEAKDAEYYDNPDYVIAAGTSGQPDVQKKKEYFI